MEPPIRAIAGIELIHYRAGERYELIVLRNADENEYLSSTFDMTVQYFDGIPANMNNKSLWIGPEVGSGPVKISSHHFPELLRTDVLLLPLASITYWERLRARRTK